jgi:hypothetical protein
MSYGGLMADDQYSVGFGLSGQSAAINRLAALARGQTRHDLQFTIERALRLLPATPGWLVRVLNPANVSLATSWPSSLLDACLGG